jgi:hypothetical protein
VVANTKKIEGFTMVKENEQKPKRQELTAIQLRQLVLAIAHDYKEKFESDRPTPKTDLSYSEMHKLCFADDKLKGKFGTLYMEGKINPKNKLSKWSLEALATFKSDFSYDATKEDVKDKQLFIASVYEEWYRKNNPEDKDKRITPSTITVANMYDYMGDIKRDSPTLPNLKKSGVLSTTWKLSHLKDDSLNEIKNFISQKAS